MSLSVNQPGTPREQPPMPRGTGPTSLTWSRVFLPWCARARRPPPAGFAARSQPSRPLPGPRSSPRHCARASSLFLLLPLPSRSGSRGAGASCVSPIPRAAAQPALLELAPPHASALRLPRGKPPRAVPTPDLPAPPQAFGTRLGPFKSRRPPPRRLEAADWPLVSRALQGSLPFVCFPCSGGGTGSRGRWE